MYNRGSFVFRLVIGLLLIGLLVGGGALVYRAGVSQGITQAPEVVEALSSGADNGQSLTFPGYGYRTYPHFGFFHFGGIFGFILITFLFFGLMKMLFFRPWAWHHAGKHGHGHWKGHWGQPWDKEGTEDDAEADVKKS